MFIFLLLFILKAGLSVIAITIKINKWTLWQVRFIFYVPNFFFPLTLFSFLLKNYCFVLSIFIKFCWCVGIGLSGRDGDGSVGSCNRGGCLEVVSLVFFNMDWMCWTKEASGAHYRILKHRIGKTSLWWWKSEPWISLWEAIDWKGQKGTSWPSVSARQHVRMRMPK